MSLLLNDLIILLLFGIYFVMIFIYHENFQESILNLLMDKVFYISYPLLWIST